MGVPTGAIAAGVPIMMALLYLYKVPSAYSSVSPASRLPAGASVNCEVWIADEVARLVSISSCDGGIRSFNPGGIRFAFFFFPLPAADDDDGDSVDDPALPVPNIVAPAAVGDVATAGALIATEAGETAVEVAVVVIFGVVAGVGEAAAKK